MACELKQLVGCVVGVFFFGALVKRKRWSLYCAEENENGGSGARMLLVYALLCSNCRQPFISASAWPCTTSCWCTGSTHSEATTILCVMVLDYLMLGLLCPSQIHSWLQPIILAVHEIHWCFYGLQKR